MIPSTKETLAYIAVLAGIAYGFLWALDQVTGFHTSFLLPHIQWRMF